MCIVCVRRIVPTTSWYRVLALRQLHTTYLPNVQAETADRRHTRSPACVRLVWRRITSRQTERYMLANWNCMAARDTLCAYSTVVVHVPTTKYANTHQRIQRHTVNVQPKRKVICMVRGNVRKKTLEEPAHTQTHTPPFTDLSPDVCTQFYILFPFACNQFVFQ